jgi:hypothetical protein
MEFIVVLIMIVGLAYYFGVARGEEKSSSDERDRANLHRFAEVVRMKYARDILAEAGDDDRFEDFLNSGYGSENAASSIKREAEIKATQQGQAPERVAAAQLVDAFWKAESRIENEEWLYSDDDEEKQLAQDRRNKAYFVRNVRLIVSKRLLERMGHPDRHSEFLKWPPASDDAVGALYLESKREAAKRTGARAHYIVARSLVSQFLKEM